ncbi:MAG: YfjI family protein [Veillonellales bacterium]
MGVLKSDIAKFLSSKTPEELAAIGIGEPKVKVKAINGVFTPIEPEPWEEPITFSESALPEFPVGCLPNWLKNYASALAESTQTPIDLASCLSLAAVSLTVARTAEVQVYPDWREPLNIWTAVFLDPSNLKSPILKALIEPIRDYEKRRIEDERGNIAEAKRAYVLLERRIEKLTEKAAKSDLKPEEREQAESELRRLARESDEMEIPASPRLIVADITAEKLTSVLAEQPGERIAILSAEGGMLFSIMAGRYSKGANFDIYLSAYSGESYTVDRRGRTETLDRPALTMGLAAQPSIIRGMATDREFKLFRERGLLARFLYSLPISKLGGRTFDQYKPIPDNVRHVYYSNILKLLELPVGETVQTIKMSLAAQGAFKQFRRELEKRMNPENGDLYSLLDWAGKLHGQVIRLAGILHIAGQAGDPYPWREPINSDTMAAAITIGLYFAEHAKVAFGSMGADKAEAPAKRILAWMKDSGQNVFERGQLYQKFKGGINGIKELDEVLEVLENQCHIRKIPVTEKRRGRKPNKYELNPLSCNSRNSCNFDEPSNDAGLSSVKTDSRNYPVIHENVPVNKNWIPEKNNFANNENNGNYGMKKKPEEGEL